LGWRFDFGVFADRANVAGIDASQICCNCTTKPIFINEQCSYTEVSEAETPSLWRDVNGYSCGHYEAKRWCADGGYGPGWMSDETIFGNDTSVEITFSIFENIYGENARQKCCSCISPTSPVFSRLECTQGSVVAKDEWRDGGGHSCKDYEDRQWCNGKGKTGPGWNDEWGNSVTVLADSDGNDATGMCCVCMIPDDDDYMDLCVDVVDGPLYRMQHTISINIYASCSTGFFILMIIAIRKQCKEQKKSGSFKLGITLIILIGCYMFLTAKAVYYYGQAIEIWSKTKAEKRNGRSVVDFTSKYQL